MSCKKDSAYSIMENDIRNIRQTMEQIDQDTFKTAVQDICRARTVYVIGIRGCAPLAQLMSFYLKTALDRVVCIDTNNASEMFEQMLEVSEKDVVIGISFPRYSKRTLRAMEFANSRNACVIAITNDVNSPMCMYSSCNLIAVSDFHQVVESFTAPMSLINALVAAIYKKREKQIAGRLSKLEDVWQEYQVYSIDELEYANL